MLIWISVDRLQTKISDNYTDIPRQQNKPKTKTTTKQKTKTKNVRRGRGRPDKHKPELNFSLLHDTDLRETEMGRGLTWHVLFPLYHKHVNLTRLLQTYKRSVWRKKHWKKQLKIVDNIAKNKIKIIILFRVSKCSWSFPLIFLSFSSSSY